MAAYPTTLPSPTQDNYGINPDDSVLRTEMEVGPPRTRRRALSMPSRIPVKWIFTLDEFAIFEAWHKWGALDGAAWFDVLLLNGLALTTYSAQFSGMWKAQLQGTCFVVTAELIVRARPMLTSDELDVAAAYSLGDIAYAAPTLHTWLHSTMPTAAYF